MLTIWHPHACQLPAYRGDHRVTSLLLQCLQLLSWSSEQPTCSSWPPLVKLRWDCVGKYKVGHVCVLPTVKGRRRGWSLVHFIMSWLSNLLNLEPRGEDLTYLPLMYTRIPSRWHLVQIKPKCRNDSIVLYPGYKWSCSTSPLHLTAGTW